MGRGPGDADWLFCRTSGTTLLRLVTGWHPPSLRFERWIAENLGRSNPGQTDAPCCTRNAGGLLQFLGGREARGLSLLGPYGEGLGSGASGRETGHADRAHRPASGRLFLS